jgi:hypothetical protein
MIIYRPHSGGTVFEGLENAIEFENELEMKEYIVKEANSHWDFNVLNIEDIVTEYNAGNDDRIGWKNVIYVCVKRYGDEDYIKKYNTPQCIGYCSNDYKTQ